MSGREPIDETAWAAWVEHVAEALEVDASGVSPRADRDPRELARVILDALPEG